MRWILGLTLCGILILTGSALARVEVQRVALDPTAGDTPRVDLLSQGTESLTLELTLPYLNLEEFAVENEVFQALTLPGGGMRGVEGQAGLPTISRLVAVPDGAAVQARVLSRRDRNLPGYRVFPVQPEGSESFVIDRQYYEGRSLVADAPAVEIGAPAILRDLRVVPITFRPVSYDPASGELTVAERLEVELDFSGNDDRNASPTRRRLIPESFDRMYSDVVLNYERDADVAVGPGTYLLIYPNVTGVLTRLQDLIEWRQRQGYNVLVASDSETGTSRTQIKNYIQNIYNTVDPPLEFVTLVGDANGSYDLPCWFENLSTYGGEGDHYYTNLEGGDVLSDVHLGRLSIRSTGELDDVVDKIVTYETAPPTTDSGWFTRAGLAADQGSSGITTKYVNQWLKQELLANGYTQVDTMWSPNPSGMSNSINQGLTVFGYRGWWGMSGMTTGYIGNLSNGYELPYAVIVTCDTGSFSDDSECQSEAFLRASNGGAVGCVGTATTGTHTRYNNCYYNGAWDGVINGSDHRLGVSHTRGKLELYNNYNDYEDSKVEIWSVWMNLMGDPATDMWTAYPADLDVSHESTLPVGANAALVTVTSGGSAVEDALVCLYKDGEVRSVGYTDYAGNANLPISGYSSGDLLVTVTKHNHMSYLGSVSLSTVSVFAGYQSSTIDDDNSGGSSGNGDGTVNPNETIELPVALHNYGTSSANGVSATIASLDPYLSITDGSESFGNIPSGATVWSAEDYDFDVAANAPDGHVLAIDLEATNGAPTWNSLIELTVVSAAFDQESYSWGGSGSTLDPGESGTLAVGLRNNGSITGTGITAVLASESPWITVTDANGSYNNIGPGSWADNSSNTFALSVSSDCFEGHLAMFTLTATFVDVVEFGLPVGTASSNDPVGPDAYGYYAFDNTDTAYPYAPTYSWVEIDPNYGGPGTDVGLSDFGWEDDDTQVMSLPFDFQYYGEVYDQVSICSNGWISMGVSSMVLYRNWNIPSAGSPNAMIAAYWDNLYQTGNNRVYYWNDTDGHRYIVQWSRMRNDYANSTETVQVILYDPAHYVTSTGDGQILVQFQTVNNNDSRDAYGSVGIQNWERTDGLLYTHANNYPPGAATLAAGRAILFMPLPNLILGYLEGDVTNASNGSTPIEGVDIRVVELDQTLVSQADGHYYGAVAQGTYTVRAEHDSFDPVQVNGVDIVEDQITNLDFALNDILGPYITNTTVLPYTSDTAGPYVVDTFINDFSDIAEMHFYYKINGGGLFELPLALIDPGTGQCRAELPGYPINTQISYWIEASDTGGNDSRDPETPDTYYEFWILSEFTVIDDDFETDLGWTVGDAGDNATTGIWVRAEPDGTYNGGAEIQPENDASADGTLCYVTGNANTDDQGTDDVDGGKTTLLSPWFDLSEALGVTVSYRRWYTNDSGSNPDSDYWQVQVTDDDVSWVSLENTNATDRSWSYRSFPLDGLIDLTSTVRFRFIASDEGGGSIVEAAIDEFMLMGFSSPDATSADGAAPARLTLLQNAPNPFNPVTQIRFGLPEAQSVSLRIYDASGRLVRTLLHERPLESGYHDLSWDGSDDRKHPVGSGIYFYKLSTEKEQLSSKMTLLK